MTIRAGRVRLIIAYDGRNFHGFQWQPGGVRTVQKVLEDALQTITDGSHRRIVGASRTDAGTHALVQVVHVDLDHPIPVERLPAALNGALPPDMIVHRADSQTSEFHAQYDVTSKTYHYFTYTGSRLSPFAHGLAYRYRWPLDPQPMREGLQRLRGTHDFDGFRATGSRVQSTVRCLSRAELKHDGDWWVFHFTADGFLYKMVRMMVGTLLEIGRGRQGVESISRALVGEAKAGPSVPAAGLFLTQIRYPQAIIGPPPEALAGSLTEILLARPQIRSPF